MFKKYLLGLVIVAVITTGMQPTPGPTQVDTEQFDSMMGAEYAVSFNENTRLLQVSIKNPTGQTLNTTYSFNVDGWEYSRSTFTLKPGESRHQTYNITDRIRVEQDVHSILLVTAGGRAEFEFNGTYSTLNPADVPVPKITDIEVDTGTARGNESTVVYVTVENPSKNVYASYVVAHTKETSASTNVANPLPGTSETVKLELLEPVGTDVQGEIRLFMGKPNETEGALAQVEFSGSAESGTEYSRESYEPFSLDGPNGGYSYDDAGSDGVPDGVPLIGAGVLGLVVLGAVWWWRG
ncbi:hypothetical protein [Salarchaeum sp. JOR-1]|uniref:hypothetical protein n=1 Tax=Salarchaeum sp. JOR-1 TaxID=2599399 RepID=UPI00119862BE|nr:hypothetical protein [Salarchaeum sp. JOR-1]QDX40922.1 hypothetical protein FQU85_08425 [Salarchaeum sp. JOR-1]